MFHLLLGDSHILTRWTTIPLFYVGGITILYGVFCPKSSYQSLVTGLFGLFGIAGVSTTPFVGRFMDRFVPWYGSLLATLLLLMMQVTYFGAGGINVTAVIIVAIGLDIGQQMQQVSQMASVYR